MVDCILRRRFYGVYEHLWMSVMGVGVAMPLMLGANAVFTPPTPK
jgi:hypothetical protein